MSARLHALRFFAACPEDVRREATFVTIDCLRWGERFFGEPAVVIKFRDDGEVVFWRAYAVEPRYADIDRLLGVTHG